MKNIFSIIIFLSLIPIALTNPIEAHEVKSEEECNKVAKELFNNLQVPIGIIHGTWRMGHPAEAYAMPELLEKVKGFEKINERIIK